MNDRNRCGGKNASGPDINTIVHDPKPASYQSKFTELFSSDDKPTTTNKPVRMPLPTETLDRNRSALTATAPPPLSVAESKTLSSASAYTGYEKAIQPLIKKSSGNRGNKKSGNRTPKVSVLPPTYYTQKEFIIEKKAEASQEMNSTGMCLGNQENWGGAVVHDYDGAKITGVVKSEKEEGEDEEQYEGDDELSSGEQSSDEGEKSE